MSKLPYMQFYVADWLLDTRCLSLAARGAWVDILCALWHAPTRGTRTLSVEDWAGEIGKPIEEISALIAELEKKQIADIVRNGNGDVSITSRRQLRDEKRRESNRLSQDRFRKKHDSKQAVSAHLQISESESEKKEKKEKKKTLSPSLSHLHGKTAFPVSWIEIPPDLLAWGTSHNQPLTGREFQKFRDHALAHDRRLKDWPAGFRNWIRRSVDDKGA